MASANSSNASVRSILENLERSLDLARQQLLEDTPNRENTDYDLNNFWTNFVGATKLVSHEATKLCMAFEGTGMTSSEECQSLVDKVERTCLTLLAVFVTLPKEKGKTLHKEILMYVVDLLQGMRNLCTALRNQRPTRLQTVGDVWEQCEAVDRLPRDNRDAVLALFREQHDMVQDASQELMETIENEDENHGFELSLVTPLNGLQIPPVQSWTNSDRNVLLPCSGLVKAVKACLKKTMQAISERGNGSDEGSINELDAIAEIVKVSSSLADDFVLSLYPPMNHSASREQASLIRNNSKELLSNARNAHFCSAADVVWIEFLEKAVDHNWVRINDMVLAD